MIDVIQLIRLAIYGFILMFILKLIFDYLAKRKEGHNIGSVRLEIMTSGRPNVKKLNLKSLWLSENGNKRINAGKIISYKKIDLEAGIKSSVINCFVVKRKKMEAPDFYLIPTESIKDGNISGDVISTLWNFKLDEDSSFLIPNNIKLVVLASVVDGVSVSVDTINRVSPLVHASIRANPIHRIRMRESGLIR